MMITSSCKKGGKDRNGIARNSRSPSISSPLVDINSFSDSTILPEVNLMDQKLAEQSSGFRAALRSIHEETSSCLEPASRRNEGGARTLYTKMPTDAGREHARSIILMNHTLTTNSTALN